jgi:hypothetical protein
VLLQAYFVCLQVVYDELAPSLSNLTGDAEISKQQRRAFGTHLLAAACGKGVHTSRYYVEEADGDIRQAEQLLRARLPVSKPPAYLLFLGVPQ